MALRWEQWPISTPIGSLSAAQVLVVAAAMSEPGAITESSPTKGSGARASTMKQPRMPKSMLKELAKRNNPDT